MFKIKDISGQRFGRLIALEPTDVRRHGNVLWKCQCDCGNICYIVSNSLRRGLTTSCGCYAKEVNRKKLDKYIKTNDLTGQRFGRLLALEPTDMRRQASVVWKCQCDCGNTHYVASRSLLGGSTTSCGCFGKETSRKQLNKNSVEYKKRNLVAGTNIEMQTRKANKNSTTGVRGVAYMKKSGLYRAFISFQGKQYDLGSYENIDEAIAKRKGAEEKLYSEFWARYNASKDKK